MAKKPEKRKCPTCDGDGKIYDVTYFGANSESHVKRSIPSSKIDEARKAKEYQIEGCSNCGNRGWTGSSNNPKQCTKCNGEGKIIKAINCYSDIPWFPSKCPRCDGTGFVVEMVKE